MFKLLSVLSSKLRCRRLSMPMPPSALSFEISYMMLEVVRHLKTLHVWNFELHCRRLKVLMLLSLLNFCPRFTLLRELSKIMSGGACLRR